MRFISEPIKNQVLCTYLPLKCIAVTVMYLLMPYVAQRPLLEYLDLSSGEYGLCLNGSANKLYAFFMCAIGSKSLSSFGLIISSIVLSTLRDVLFIRVFHKYIEGRYLTLFVILLATHPYLAYAHMRFTTDLFASLGVLHIFLHLYYEKKIDVKFLLIAIALSGFRNGLIFVYSGVAIFETYKHMRLQKNQAKILMPILLLVAAFFSLCFTPVWEYLQILPFGASYGPYSLQQLFAAQSQFGEFFALVAILPSLIISHLVLLLGFREIVAGYGFSPLVVESAVITAIQIIGSVILLLLHFVGLIGYFKFLENKKYFLLIPFLYVVPVFLLVAHLRYFAPLIPIVLFGFVLQVKKYNLLSPKT